VSTQLQLNNNNNNNNNKNKGRVIQTFNYSLGIRTRKQSRRRSEKAIKAEIILGIPEA
jgi:hypothetical protein